MKPATLLLLMLLLLAAGEASAAPRGLLMLGDLSQWVDFEYQYEGSETSGRNSDFFNKQHFLRERYNLQFAYAIFDQRLLHGGLGAGVDFDQTFSSSSGSGASSGSRNSTGTGFRYNFSGVLLDRSAFPVSFHGLSQLVHAQREFSTPYDLTVDTYGVSLSLKNAFLPVRADYTRSTSETDGLVNDQMMATNSVNLEVLHQEGPRSTTTGRLTLADSSSTPKGGAEAARSRNYSAALFNQLHLSERVAERTLISRLEKRDESRSELGTSTDVRTVQLNEQLAYPLGKALNLGASYDLTRRQLPLSSDLLQTGQVWLEHALFESLTTRLEGNYRSNDTSIGEEEDLGASLGLNYRKKLPHESLLQLSLTESYLVTDRHQSAVVQSVLDEPHTAQPGRLDPAVPAPIVLNTGNVNPASITVRNADPAVRILPYVENTDYSVQQFGSQTQLIILPSPDGIKVGDNLLVSYTFVGDPQVSYSTTSTAAGFTLALFNYAYRIYGNWLNSSENLLSGEARQIRLTDRTIYRLGFEATRAVLAYGAEYENSDSGQDKHQTTQAFVRATRRVGRGTLSLSLADGYTKSEPTAFASGSETTSVNSIGANGSYSTLLLNTAHMLLTARYFNIRGDTLSRDDISLGMNLDWSYGKISASLQSQLIWRLSPETTSQDQSVQLKVTRFF